MIVTGQAVAQFVSEKVGAAICPPYTTMGLVRGNELVAGAVFNHFEGFDLHVTIAGAGWSRQFIEAVGSYVFGQLGCLRMTAVTEQRKVAEYTLRLGGMIEGTLRDHFGPGREGLILGILRHEWKYGRYSSDCAADFTSRASDQGSDCGKFSEAA